MNIAAALDLLIGADVPVSVVQEVFDNMDPERFDKRLILSLVPGLWPDPEQCPDQC